MSRQLSAAGTAWVREQILFGLGVALIVWEAVSERSDHYVVYLVACFIMGLVPLSIAERWLGGRGPGGTAD